MPVTLSIATHEREELLDITPRLRAWLREQDARDGVLHLWALHTTCALTVNEGADPDVARDVLATLRRLVPHSADYRHAEGNADAHIKTLLTGPGLTLLVEDGDLVLGIWQHVFLAEFDGPRSRRIALRLSPAG